MSSLENDHQDRDLLQGLLSHVKRTSNQLQRLRWALAVAEVRIEARSELVDLHGPEVERLLQGVRDAQATRDPDVGWALLHSALELETVAYTSEQIDGAITELARQVAGRHVTGWAADAVSALLQQATCVAPGCSQGPGHSHPEAPPDVARRTLLRCAMKVRNDFFNSAFYAERIIAQRRLILVSIGMLLVGFAFLMAWLTPDTHELGDLQIPVSSALAGMIGAVASASQRLVAHPSTAAPTDMGSFTAVVVRLFIGAAAALTVYFAVLSEFVNLPATHRIAFLILASFGVGFAERLVVYHPPQAAAVGPAEAPPVRP